MKHILLIFRPLNQRLSRAEPDEIHGAKPARREHRISQGCPGRRRLAASQPLVLRVREAVRKGRQRTEGAVV